MKTFALFFFIPLVIFKNKNILKILFLSISAMSITMLSRFIYRNDDAFIISSNFSDDKISALFTSGIHISFGNASLLVIAFITLLVFVYLKNPSSDQDFIYESIYISLISISILFIFVSFPTYWAILLAPFISMVAFSSKDKSLFKTNMILCLAIDISLILINYVFHGENLDTVGLKFGVLKYIFRTNSLKTSFIDFIYNNNLLYIQNIAVAIFAICIIILIIINMPNSFKKEQDAQEHQKTLGVFLPERSLMIVKPLIIIVFFIIPTIASYFIHPAYSFNSGQMSYSNHSYRSGNMYIINPGEKAYTRELRLKKGVYQITIISYTENSLSDNSIKVECHDRRTGESPEISNLVIDGNTVIYNLHLNYNTENLSFDLFNTENQKDILFKNFQIVYLDEIKGEQQ